MIFSWGRAPVFIRFWASPGRHRQLLRQTGEQKQQKETEKAKSTRKKQKRQAIPIVIDLGTGAATRPLPRPNQAHPKTDGPDRKTAQRKQTTETRRDEDRQTHAQGHLPTNPSFRGLPRRRCGQWSRARTLLARGSPLLPRPQPTSSRPT